MDMALEASGRFKNSSSIKTVGAIIHNEQAIEHLRARGIGQIGSGLEGSEGTLVVRAHGIPFPEFQHLASLKKQGKVRLFNGTCPEVAKVQACIKRYSSQGYFVIILGDMRHPEVVAHQSYAAQGCSVVASLEEAKGLSGDLLQRAVVVAQTTFKRDDFKAIADHLRTHFPHLVIRNTICRDTWERQAEAEALVRSVDFVIVVGGKASNNTRHLVEIARRNHKPVQHVETSEGLDLLGIQGFQEIGVLAGASTPHWIVEEVIEAVEASGRPVGLWRRASRLIEILHGPYALGFGALILALHRGLPWDCGEVPGILMLTLTLGGYAWAPYLEAYGLDAKGKVRGHFLRRHEVLFKALGTTLLLTSWGLAWSLGMGSFLLVNAMILGGWGYLAFQGAKLASWNPRHLPGSRDLGQALLPPLLGVGLPWLQGYPISGPSVAAGLCLFMLALAYHLDRHLRDFRNDQILDRDLLPIAVGVAPARWIARLGAALGIVLLLGLIAGRS